VAGRERDKLLTPSDEERAGERHAEREGPQNRGQHAINVVTVLTRASVGYAKFFGRIPYDKSCASRRAMDQTNSPLVGGQGQ